MRRLVAIGSMTVFACLVGLCRAGSDYHVIPFDVDPPVQVDGDLADWEGIPNPLVLEREEQVTYTPELWQGRQDLSGVVRLAWRRGGIFVGAEVRDDAVNQPYRARDMWKGDHLNLWVDLTPGQEADRTMFGQGQFHVGLSPGALGTEEGQGAAGSPEIYVFRPEGLEQKGGEIVARRTAVGYCLEAFVPWERLGCEPVVMNQDANFEVGISEADGAPARQEMMMTYGTDKWVYSRRRMLPVVFGDGNGVGLPPAREVAIRDQVKVPAGGSESLRFSVGPIADGKEAFVFFRARIHAASVLGVKERALAVELNGTRLAGDRVANRRAESRFFMGKLQRFVWPDGALGVFMAHGFDRPHHSKKYSLMDYGPNCDYEFSVPGVLRQGENTLRFLSLLPGDEGSPPHTITLGDVALRIRAQAPPTPVPEPAPVGELPVVEPRLVFPKSYSGFRGEPTRIRFSVGGEDLEVGSRFSAPDGRWYTGSSPFYRHEREVIEHNEWVEVHDRFVNLTSENVPLMQEHSCALGERLRAVWLAGARTVGLGGKRTAPENPSVLGVTGQAGVGMFPLNDEFLVHVETSSTEAGELRLADRSFVLSAGSTYTAEWAIVPVPVPDFWEFVNRARRARDVNFTLRWTFAFMSQPWPVTMWTDEQFREFIDNKSADFVVVSNNLARVRGRYPRCTEMYEADLSAYRDFFRKFRRLYRDGDAKCGHYYHCFLDTTPANAEAFHQDRALDGQGNHMDYGGKGSYMKLYLPTLRKGGWGEEIAKWVDLILDDFGADGIFWDEFTRSRAPFLYDRWDGCTADIDPETLEVLRLKGSVTLLSLPFREALVKRILGEGRPFVINGGPHTRTMVRHKFMAFTETGSITNCRRMLLHSPVALGDHLTERVEEDAYHVMLAALDHGCLYSWYATRVFPTHKTLTEHMFPFTPIELHSGYVIGQERIITKRSGLFGWGDASACTAYVYDRTGRLTGDVAIPRVMRGGKAYAEVRIPGGHSVALVRGGGR